MPRKPTPVLPMIRTAVVGAGYWGPNLIRNFHNGLRSSVVMVVDQDVSRREETKKRFPGIQTSADISEALSNADVDAVVIATPTRSHFEMARKALDAGKHVLVEKPIATSTEEAEELGRLADKAGLVLMVGHVFLFNPGVRRVRELIVDGSLGRIYYASMTRVSLGPIRLDVDAGWDLASQDISIANYWLSGRPATVTASAGNWINQGVNDAVFMTLRYPEGAVVHVQVSWLSPRKIREATVVGEHRMLTLDDMNVLEPLRIYDKGVAEEKATRGWIDSLATFRASLREGDVVIPRVTLGEPLRTECDHFLTCIETKERPLTDARQAGDVVRVLAAMDRSLKNQSREEAV